MTVYVDDMRAKFGRLVMCHMIADTEDEMHAMADKIGVARKWYQVNHYDIAMSKRALAVEYGAVEITLRQAAKMRNVWLSTGRMPQPSEVSELYRQDAERIRARFSGVGGLI